jgi:hypothetical protein
MGHLFLHSSQRKAHPILPHLINKGKWSGEEPHLAPSGGTYGKSGMQEMQKGFIVELAVTDRQLWRQKDKRKAHPNHIAYAAIAVAVMLDTGGNVLLMRIGGRPRRARREGCEEHCVKQHLPV